MPIYEYACAACGHQFEEWQKMSDAPVRTCPKCKKKKVERLISRTAFQLKGSGWYADLYSSSKPGDSKGNDGKGKDAKGDSKSAEGADTSSSKESATPSEGTAKSGGTKKESKKKETAAKKAESRAA